MNDECMEILLVHLSRNPGLDRITQEDILKFNQRIDEKL